MSTMSIGALNQFADVLENNDWTASDLTKLRQFKNLSGIKDLINGKAELSYLVRKWREENGVIYFPITSDGTPGEEWITRLESKGFRVSDYAKSVLRSKNFKPTSGITYEIAVLKGELFNDNERITKSIRKNAKNRKFATPNAEVACLIRENFSDKELESMGLYWIVTMHEPIKDSGGVPFLLDALRSGDGSWLDADYGVPGSKWDRGNGFAFVVSQVSGS